MTYNKNEKSDYISILNQIKKEGNSDKSINANDKVLIIDGLNTFIRSHSVNPAVNDDGVHIGGLTGFLKSIKHSISLFKPSRCIIVFDGKDGSKSRRKIYPEYKQNRGVKKRLNRNVDWSTSPINENESMSLQLSRLLHYLESMPVTIICIDGTEADDVISYIAKSVLNDSNITIVSTDKDFIQLVDDRINVWSPTKKIIYNPESVFDEYGIPSKNFLLYRMMEGDKSDNIPGVRGVGLKYIIKNLPMMTENKRVLIKDIIDFVENTKSKKKVLNTIKDSKELLNRNFLLMQLFDVDIKNSSKLKIQESINREIPKLIKYEIQMMFISDKLQSQILNLDNWMQEFIRLDRIGSTYNGR